MTTELSPLYIHLMCKNMIILQKLKQYFPYIVIFIIAFALSQLISSCGKEKVPPIVEVPKANSDAKRTERIIERTVERQAPKQQWYSNSQQVADETAQQVGKKDKADKIIKESQEKKVEGSDQTITENKYYGIHLERKHKIKLGVANVDHTTYTTLAYQNRSLEYRAYYSTQGKTGIGVEYTVAQW